MTENSSVPITFKTQEGAILPEYKTSGSSGFDISSYENTTIAAGKWSIVSTGLFAEIPPGFEIQVRSRSGLAFKHGVFVLNSPGTVDSDYRGEIKVILANYSDKDFIISKGERIAQLVLSKVYIAEISKASEINDTSRGAGGFGHTGL